MSQDLLGPVGRVMVGTDRSDATEHGVAERTRAEAAQDDLRGHVQRIAGDRGHAVVVVDDDPAMAIVHAAEDEKVDVLVVGNAGMAGRKEFLLGNVPNRISHNARCTVLIVNTTNGLATALRSPPSVA